MSDTDSTGPVGSGGAANEQLTTNAGAALGKRVGDGPPVPSGGPSIRSHGRRLPWWVQWVVIAFALAVGIFFGMRTDTFAPAVETWSDPDREAQYSLPLLTIGLYAVVTYVLVMIVVAYLYEGRRYGGDRVATTVITGAFLVALLPLISLLWTSVQQGWEAISWSFLTHNNVGASVETVETGLGHAIVGTFYVTLLTAAAAIPLGIFTAIYLVEYGKGPFARAVTFLVDIMTGIPSIVAGLFAVAMLTMIMGQLGFDSAPAYRSGAMGAVALLVLMTPIVVRNTEEMLRLVPNELREASYALGVPKWLTIVKVVLRTSVAGIISGVVIAVARVIGESAPLMITAMSTDVFNYNPFDNYMMTLPVYVYNTFRTGDFEASWGGALVLIFIVLVFNLIARFVAAMFAPKGEK
ncbi:phosphate ABC transporter permease PstA [Georgenia sp. Z1491]|uniref:phosphate ABC transporter permease PstA n=1 Tax=Georgenia sp. Z1491 TaxID=3416707 RepID=UPI003CE8EC2A